jgi:carboxylesterase type B
VTLAGQSTGGSLVRTLLATPSADTLFSKAILQSAPLDYGDQSEVTGNALGALYLEHINCNTMACLQTTSVDTILPAQAATVGGATSVGSDDFIPGVSQAEPFRPIVDGVLVRGNLLKWDTPLVSLSQWHYKADIRQTRRDRVFMLTTVKDEAAAQISTVSQSFSGTGEPAPIDSSLYSYIVTYLLTPIARANAVLTSGLYDVDTSAADGTRDTLVQLGSD